MTRGDRDQLLAGIFHTIRPEYLWRHAVRELTELTNERATLFEQPPVEPAVREEPDEGARLTQESAHRS